MEVNVVVIEFIVIAILGAMLINLFDELKEIKKLKSKRKELENEIQKLKERGLME